MDSEALRFIDLYESGLPAAEVARRMGWRTKNPQVAVQRKKAKLRSQGYAILNRQDQDHGEISVRRQRDLLADALRIIDDPRAREVLKKAGL